MSRSQLQRRWMLSRSGWTGLVCCLSLLAFALRVYHIDAFSFWLDEGLTPLRSGYGWREILSNKIWIQGFPTTDTHPALYYLFIALTRSLLGDSDLAFRLPSALLGTMLVPLLYQFGRELADRRVGAVAALLVAINPLQVWYGQEARMYTLLVFLGTVASYALWGALRGRSLRRQLIIYLISAGLGLYTHFTMVFLIGVHMLFWVWVLWQRGARRLLLGAGLVILLVAIPLAPIAIPRLLAGPENNYFYVAPQIILQDIVHGYGLGLTSDFSLWSTRFFDLATLLVLLLGLWGGRRSVGGPARSFLLAYLFATAIGLFAGSLLFKPMYQGVRHIMLGAPAFFLLLGRGVVSLQRRHWALLCLLILLPGPLISLNNLYHDPQYAKDDFRGLVAYIEAQAGPDDLVVYNNAIYMLMHLHYGVRDDLTVTAQPVYPYLAGPDTEAALADFARQHQRIWFVPIPPINDRDADGLVRHWLEARMTRVNSRGFAGRNLSLSVWGLVVDERFDELPPESVAMAGDWPGWPALVGWRLPDAQPALGPTLWFDLFWTAGAPQVETPALRLQLVGADGAVWVDGTAAWVDGASPADEAAAAYKRSLSLALPPGLAPGAYTARLLPWNQADNQAAGDWLTLGQIDIGLPSDWPYRLPLDLLSEVDLAYDEGLVFRGAALLAASIKPGHPVPLRLYWETAALPADLTYRLETVAADGSVIHAVEGTPGPDWLTGRQWAAPTLIMEQQAIVIPPTATPGQYTLRWQLLRAGEPLSGRPPWRWPSRQSDIGNFTVEPWPLETTLPDQLTPVGATFGETISLAGFAMQAPDPLAGNVVTLTLYWQAQAVPTADYLVFVHLIDPATGTIVAQSDQGPVGWLRPTSGWRAGEVLADSHQLLIPADLPAGAYELSAGLYLPDSFSRPPVSLGNERLPGGAVPLLTLTEAE